MGLFREEALAARQDRLEGEVSLALPVSWQLVGALLFGLVASALAILLLVRVDRVVGVTLVGSGDTRPLAVIPDETADALRTGACGTIRIDTSDGAPARACLTGWAGSSALFTMPDGAVREARVARFAVRQPIARGTRLQADIAVGRVRLIDTVW